LNRARSKINFLGSAHKYLILFIQEGTMLSFKKCDFDGVQAIMISSKPLGYLHFYATSIIVEFPSSTAAAAAPPATAPAAPAPPPPPPVISTSAASRVQELPMDCSSRLRSSLPSTGRCAHTRERYLRWCNETSRKAPDHKEQVENKKNKPFSKINNKNNV
jgi:hypothetical protein